MITRGDLFPDQIVFLKNGIVIVESIYDLNNLIRRSETQLPVILIPKKGILVPQNFKEVNEDTLLGLSMIISRIPENSSLNYLTEKERNELLEWDLENIVKKLIINSYEIAINHSNVWSWSKVHRCRILYSKILN